MPDDFHFQHAEVQLNVAEPLDALRARLDALHAADKAAERKRARIKPWLWVTGIGTFLGFFIVVTLVLFVPFVILLWMYRNAGLQDVEDRRLDVALHLIESLESELDPKSNVVLDMDFRSYQKTQGRREGAVSIYTQPWMRMGLVLRDGSALQITAATLCKRKSKRKRKYTKTKDKVVEELALDIRPGKGKRMDAQSTGRVAKALARPLPGARLKRCRVRPRGAEVVFATEALVRVEPHSMYTGRTNLLDANKVLALTVLSYRATNRAGTSA